MNLQKSVLTTKRRIEFLGVTVDSLTLALFVERESVESLKAVAYNFFVELEHQS